MLDVQYMPGGDVFRDRGAAVLSRFLHVLFGLLAGRVGHVPRVPRGGVLMVFVVFLQACQACQAWGKQYVCVESLAVLVFVVRV